MSKSKIDQWAKALLRKLFERAADKAVKVIKEEVKNETQNESKKALGNPSGELLNHLVKISAEDTSDPNLSIGAAVRWLFRKLDLASHRLKRQATWREGIAEYKGYLKDMVSGKHPNPEQMQKLDEIYKRLKE